MVENRRASGIRPDDPRYRAVPVEAPRELHGFRFARLFDGFERHDPPPVPRIDPARRIDDPAERERLLGYLESGAPVARSDAAAYDWLDPDRGLVVPQSWYTDGTWVWPAGLAYYLREHGVGPEPEFAGSIRAAGYQVPEVTPERTDLAWEALRAWGDLKDDLRREYLASQERSAGGDLPRGEASNQPPTTVDLDGIEKLMNDEYDRFPPPVLHALGASWWLPGRDVSARVDPWLRDFSERRSELDGSRHEIFPAAERVLHEFGLLDIHSELPGEEVGVFDVHFFPLEKAWQEPLFFRSLAQQLDSRVFPVGRTDDGVNQLVVDERGRTFLAHAAGNFFLGETIDEALVRLVLGRRAPRVTHGRWDWDG